MSQLPPNTSVTQAKLINYRHNWEIRNYKFCEWNNDKLTSPRFTVPDYGNEEWYLELTRVDVKTDDRRHRWLSYVSLALILDGEPKNLLMNLTLGLDDLFPSSFMTFLSKVNGIEKFISQSDLLSHTSCKTPDIIRIFCKIQLRTRMDNLRSVNDAPHFDIPKCNLSSHLELLYNDETTADVTLTVGDRKFHAHKAILVARSSVFAAMFRNTMKETITKNVNIENLDADIFEEILRFIYTDKTPDLKSKAIDLLDAADRYDLQKLKILCEQTLYKNVNVESAAEILIMADRHRAHQLKTQVLGFIKSHMEEVINTEGYKEMEKHHAGLITEAFRAFAVL